jgi:hypothetical protein
MTATPWPEHLLRLRKIMKSLKALRLVAGLPVLIRLTERMGLVLVHFVLNIFFPLYQ